MSIDTRISRLHAARAMAGPLLARIATGEAHPADPLVKSEAARLEAVLRSLLALDSSLGELGDGLADVLFNAFERGRLITIRSGEPVPSPSSSQVRHLVDLVDTMISAALVDSELPVTLFARPDGGAMTVVAPIAGLPLARGWIDRLGASELTVEQTELDDEVLVEVRWTAS